MIRKANLMPTDRDIRRRIAENVTYYLEVRGLSRRDLAKKTGDSPSSIARVASGKHTAGAGVVVRVADALGVSVDRLLVATPTIHRR
jgi:transcriptional regulator with XRE-family HTH domain